MVLLGHIHLFISQDHVFFKKRVLNDIDVIIKIVKAESNIFISLGISFSSLKS